MVLLGHRMLVVFPLALGLAVAPLGTALEAVHPSAAVE